ncbi:hypothetical protein UlMin_015001 [Ulmus minor]
MTTSTHQEPKTNEPENHHELHKEEETISSSSSSSPQSNRSYKSPLSHRSYKSPQSNRSFQTPSPLPDPSADYSDHSQEDHGFEWIENKPANPPSLHPNRSFPAEPLVVTQALDPEAQDGFAGIGEVHEGGGEGTGSFNRRKLRPDLSNRKTIKKDNQSLVKKVLLGFRICGFAFCLISFSIMAANKNKGWALDSFYRYKELRYCLAVNVVGFGYSLLQVFDLIHFLVAEKHFVQHRFRHYFDFFMDQIISYLLMSASSSAATRVEDWESNWGKDKFPDMAHASVGLSFAAFVALACSSIVSGYIAFTPKSF